MPVMVHPDLPNVQRTVTESAFAEVWSKSGWLLEEKEQPKQVAEPKKEKGNS